MNFEEKLAEIRANFKDLKNHTNPAGGYAYRNAGELTAKVKSLCKTFGLTMKFTEKPVCIGNHNYAIVTLIVKDPKSGEYDTAESFAREDDVQTMPSSSMMSKTSISMAHKSVLEAMFAIDDGSMDPDGPGGIPVQDVQADMRIQAEASSAYAGKAAESGMSIPMPAGDSSADAGYASAAAQEMQAQTAGMQASAGIQEAQTAENAGSASAQADSAVQGFPAAEQGIRQEAQVQTYGADMTGGVSQGYPEYRIPEPADYGLQDAEAGDYAADQQMWDQPADLPEFARQAGSEPVFPWEVQETSETGDGSPDASGAEQETAAAAAAESGGKRCPEVFGVTYEIAFSRAKVLTDEGILYYKAFEKDSPSGPWSHAAGKDLSGVDFDALYEAASKSAGTPLAEYAGPMIP